MTCAPIRCASALLLLGLVACGGDGVGTPDGDDAARPEATQTETAVKDTPSMLVRPPTAEEKALLDELVALRQRGQAPRGVERAREFLATHPEAFPVHYALGVLHGAADHHAEALQAFEAALAVEPRHLGSLRGRAISLHRMGRFDEARATLESALALAPTHGGVQLDLGRLLGELGELEPAEELLRSAAATEAAAWNELGTVLRRQGRLDEAAEAFRQRLARDPHDPAALLNLGQILVAQGEVDAGEEVLARHAEKAALRDQLDLYRRSSMLDGATAANFLHLAELQLRFDQSVEAERSYARALEIDSQSVTAALGLAALRLAAGDLEAASRWAVHALLHARDDDPKPHFVLGLIRLRRGQLDAADEAFEQSRARRAWDAETWRHAGDAWSAAGEAQRAVEARRRADGLDG